MIKKIQYYYVLVQGAAALKVNTLALDETIKDMGFRRCNYAEYLKAVKLLRKNDEDMAIELQGDIKKGKGKP